MNFDYFVERGTILNEMARQVAIFGNYPEVKNSYINLYNKIKNSGDVNPSQTSQIRNRLYNFTERFLNQLPEEVMEYYSSIATNSNTRFANWAKIMDDLLNQGKINPRQLVTFWDSIFEPSEGDDSTSEEDSDEDSKMLSYITSDDSDEVSNLNSNLRIGVNRRMRELTGDKTYPMSYLQYTKLYSYLEPRLRQALNASRQLKKSQGSEVAQESSVDDLSNPYEDVQGWIETAAETLREGILSYKELYDSGELELDEIVDEYGKQDRLAQVLVQWKRENFEKSLSDIVTSFGNLKNSPSPDKFLEKMTSLSDQFADAGNKSASALFMALGREFKELYQSEAPEDYTETDEQPYVGFDTRAIKKVFGLGEGLELFKAWYEFRKSLQDFNMERLDFRKSNAFVDAKEKIRAYTTGSPIETSNQSGLTKAIVRQRAVVASMEDSGQDATKEKLKLKKMEDSLGSSNRTVEPKQQKNPWQKKIDDTQIRIQHAQEQLQTADPAYAKELKQSIGRMNAELEMFYQKASEWQPVQESVFSYMEEQTYKDSKLKSKGVFVDKGYKKPTNYGQWMMLND